MDQLKLDEIYWNERYLAQNTGWDIGTISTPIKTYIDQLTNKDLAILIPGCGNAYEADYLLQNGFTNVTLIDLAPTLTAQLSAKFQTYVNRELKIITGDFFEHQGNYDLILEQTFFCALDPTLRTSYVQHMAQLLKPRGKLVGLLFNQKFDVNPPFGGDEQIYRTLFEPHFTIQTLASCYNSIPPRAGKELFFVVYI
jgi:SAM-dependent methyltransferase